MPVMTYLVGLPASGKRTIGKELSAMTGAALIDNHLINDPIFLAYGADGFAPLPGWVWDLVAQVRKATLAAVERGVPTTSHIFTNYLSDDPSEEQPLDQLRGIAETRGAAFVPVWLTCPTGELKRRIDLPDRRERQKMRDPDELEEIARTKGTLPPPPDALVLDTSTLAPRESAQRIVDHVAARERSSESGQPVS